MQTMHGVCQIRLKVEKCSVFMALIPSLLLLLEFHFTSNIKLMFRSKFIFSATWPCLWVQQSMGKEYSKTFWHHGGWFWCKYFLFFFHHRGNLIQNSWENLVRNDLNHSHPRADNCRVWEDSGGITLHALSTAVHIVLWIYDISGWKIIGRPSTIRSYLFAG